MEQGNKFFDDVSKLMTNAMGVAQGAKTEAETAMRRHHEKLVDLGGQALVLQAEHVDRQ